MFAFYSPKAVVERGDLGDEFTPLAVFAQPAEDRQACINFMRSKGIAFKPAFGYYKGVIEFAFVIRDDSEGLREIAIAGFLDSQTIVLQLGPKEAWSGGVRLASLVAVADGCFTVLPDDLGEWRAVSRDEALELDAWTYDLEQGRFYAAVPPAA